MRKFLDTGDTTSETVTMAGGLFAFAIDHNNTGTWDLQIQLGGGIWVTTGQTFDEDSYVSGLIVHQNAKLRLTGGTAGAVAWITGTVTE